MDDAGNSNKVRSHRDLIVWGLAMDLTVEVYKLAKVLPKDELYRLTAQVTRAVVSFRQISRKVMAAAADVNMLTSAALPKDL